MDQLIDFDGLFEEKLAQYMKQNAGKYTEKQWEAIIPKLYCKFGNIRIAKIGNTPIGYYREMTDSRLLKLLTRHIREDVPVSDFLRRELESRGNPDGLLTLLNSGDSRLVAFAVDLIGGDPKAFPAYFELLSQNVDESVKDPIVELLKAGADSAKELALAYYERGIERELMLEILSRVTSRDARVLQTLLGAFRSGDDFPLHSAYLASYGDEAALPVLLETIDRDDINYLEFRELKCAIEALGGEYSRERDFTQDAYYLEISEQSALSADPEKTAG